MTTYNSQTTILFVEDSIDDYKAAEFAFRRAGLANPIVHCERGEDALDFLFRRNRYEDREGEKLPGLVLLDLNLPGLDGHDVLSEIRNHEALIQLPIIVLTTSDDDKDIERCYRAGANSFIHKPVDFNGFIRAIQTLYDYWFEVVLLPR